VPARSRSTPSPCLVRRLGVDSGGRSVPSPSVSCLARVGGWVVGGRAVRGVRACVAGGAGRGTNTEGDHNCLTCSTTRSSSPSGCSLTSSTRSTCSRATPSSRRVKGAQPATCHAACLPAARPAAWLRAAHTRTRPANPRTRAEGEATPCSQPATPQPLALTLVLTLPPNPRPSYQELKFGDGHLQYIMQYYLYN
jgi:hypothetical protein